MPEKPSNPLKIDLIQFNIEKDTKEKLGWIGMKMAVPPERVGEIAIRKTLKKRMIIVPGTLAKISSILIRVLPRSTVVAFYDRAGRRKK